MLSQRHFTTVPRLACLLSILLSAVTPVAAQGVLTTIAGTDWLFPGDGRLAINAPLNGSYGLDVTADQKGNFYIADDGNQMIFRVGADGIINVVAGNGILFPSGDGGLAINAGLADPLSVAVDGAGNLYIGEYAGTIRKVTPDGIITKIAGTGDSGFSGDGGPAIDAQFYAPYGIAVDGAGNIYVADTFNARIRKITPDGVVHTIAGGGKSLSDGISATDYHLGVPLRIRTDAAGNLYIVNVGDDLDNSNYKILKVDARGIITTIAGGGQSFDDGVPARTAAILPAGLAVDGDGNVYLIDAFPYSIRKVDTQGIITTLAGSGKAGFSGDGGPAIKATLSFGPYASLAIDNSGNILVADDANGRIRRIDKAGIINTVAGNSLFHFSGDGGPAVTATLDTPTGITGDKDGNLFFTEPFVSRIRRIAPDGTISVFAGTSIAGYTGDGGPATSARIGYPEYLAFAPDGSLAFSDALECVVRSISPTGIISTLAGSADSCDLLTEPAGIDFDGAGNLAVAEIGNNRIRVLLKGSRAAGLITIAGTGQAGYSGDGGPAIKAQLHQPTGLRIHGGGIYFCDALNNVVRYIDFATGNISTVAGNGIKDFSGDGGPATKASLSNPQSILFDAAGNMYIADTSNSHIRKVDTSGIITSVAGRFGTDKIGDGQPPLSAFIGAPADLYFRGNGDLIYTDFYSNRVREIVNIPPGFQVSPTTLAFTTAAGSDPVDLAVDITSAVPGLSFTASTSSPLGVPPWLHTSVTAGQMPATVRVTADASNMSAGKYTATVTIHAPAASQPSISIPIALTVTAAGQPTLSVKPGSLTFPYTTQATARSRPIAISNTGGGQIAWTAKVTTTTGGDWLRPSSSGGLLDAFGSTSVNVSADPGGLSPGTYSAVVTVSSADAAQKISLPVTMTITASTHTILIPETGLSFFAVEGGGSPPPQTIDILNSGSGQMPWTVSTSTLTGGPWLTPFPTAGQTEAASVIVPQVRVNVNPQGLSAGTYYGSVQVSSSGATNDPQFVSVIFTVLPRGSKLGPIVQPSGLIFTTSSSADAPGSQTITIQSTSDTPVNFTSGRVTTDGAKWIQAVPDSGTVTQTQPARIVIQPVTSDLAPGVYRGALTLLFSDGSSRAIALVLVIPNTGAPVSGTTRTPRANTQGVCQPTTLAPVFTSISNGFNVPAGYPGPTYVKVVDDCANPMVTGGVTITFNNGDPPLLLTSLKNGSWAGTWVPRTSAAEVTMTAIAAIPEHNLKGQTSIKVGSLPSDPVPSINPDGVVNGASFAPLGPVAPGSIVAVFGNRLAAGPLLATDLPLPVSLAGASLLIGGQQAPLFFSSDGQLNAMVPYGMTVNTTQQAIATRATSLSVPQSLVLAPAAPGIFTFPGSKQAIVVDVDASGGQTIVDTTHPAHIGHALVIYCTGLGEVDPPVQSGAGAPSNPLSKVVNPVTVTIGGIPVQPLFAGLTPTQVGLYQVNIVIPSGVTPGTQVPLVLTSSGQSSAPVTITVQ